jgi:hypothetical protein
MTSRWIREVRAEDWEVIALPDGSYLVRQVGSNASTAAKEPESNFGPGVNSPMGYGNAL